MHLKASLKTVPHRTPLYKQMALKDNERENTALELQKKRLEEIRNLHKPIGKNDMMEHALKYEQIRQQKEIAVKEKRKAETLAEK